MSWKAAKGLRILPVHYPDTVPDIATTEMPATTPTVDVKVISATTLTQTDRQTDNELIKAYHTVFDGQIRVMQEEEFHISLATNAKPFCVLESNVVSLSYCSQRQVGKGQHEATLIDFHVIAYIRAVILLLLLHVYAVQVLHNQFLQAQSKLW